MSSDPHLRMQRLQLQVPLPEPVEAIAALFTKLIIEDIVKGKVTTLVLVTLRGQEAKLWQLHDLEAPDDIMRALAKQESAEALAVVHPAPVPPEVEGADRCFNIAVETGSGKFDQLVALRGGAGLGGEQFRVYGKKHGEPRYRWFGVEPEGEVTMWMEGPIGYFGPAGEA